MKGAFYDMTVYDETPFSLDLCNQIQVGLATKEKKLLSGRSSVSIEDEVCTQ